MHYDLLTHIVCKLCVHTHIKAKCAVFKQHPSEGVFYRKSPTSYPSSLLLSRLDLPNISAAGNWMLCKQGKHWPVLEGDKDAEDEEEDDDSIRRDGGGSRRKMSCGDNGNNDDNEDDGSRRRSNVENYDDDNDDDDNDGRRRRVRGDEDEKEEEEEEEEDGRCSGYSLVGQLHQQVVNFLSHQLHLLKHNNMQVRASFLCAPSCYRCCCFCCC